MQAIASGMAELADVTECVVISARDDSYQRHPVHWGGWKVESLSVPRDWARLRETVVTNRRLRSALREHTPGILHVQTGSAKHLLLSMAVRRPPLVVFSIHEVDDNPLTLLLMRLIRWRTGGAIVTDCARTWSALRGLRILDGERIDLVPLGALPLVARPAVPDVPPERFLRFGRSNAKKGVDDFIAVARCLVARDSALSFTMIGGDVVGDGEPSIDGAISRLPSQPSLEDALVDHDAYLQTSRFEGFGMALVEAALAGRFVVSTRTGVADELTLGLGIVPPTAQPSDVPGLVAAIEDLRAVPPDEALRSLELQARRASSLYGHIAVGNRYLRYYGSLLARRAVTSDAAIGDRARRYAWKVRRWTASMVRRTDRRNDDLVASTADGLTLGVYPMPDGISDVLASGQAYEPGVAALIDRYLAPGATFVDIGAHVGYHSLRAAARVGPAGRVIAFEPHPRSFRMLLDNVHRNGLGSVITPFNAAASDADGVAWMNTDALATGSHSLSARRRGQGLFLPTMAIGPLLVGLDVARAVLKIDVEGHELTVLQSLVDRAELRESVAVVEYFTTLYDDPELRTLRGFVARCRSIGLEPLAAATSADLVEIGEALERDLHFCYVALRLSAA